MRYFPAAFETLTEQFARLPGIGSKTAQRLAFHVLSLPDDAAAEFARLAVQSGTRDILLAHLSKENNTPELAEYAVARALQSAGLSVRLGVAPRDTMSEVHLCRRSPSFASAN